MAFNFSPKVVTSGLVLYLDAANNRSYVSGSTTWYDLSGNNKNATLINGVSFTTASNGAIVFDGVDDYAAISSYSDINFNSSTLIYVARLDPSPNARNTVFSQYYGGTGAQMEWFDYGLLRSNYRQNGVATPENEAPNGSGQISAATNYHVTVTYTAGTISHYKNGRLLGSNANATQTNINGIGDLNIGRNSSAGLYFKGRIYCVLIYNRVLSENEILQNYNATKARFSLT